jgi:hypothetical protein
MNLIRTYRLGSLGKLDRDLVRQAEHVAVEVDKHLLEDWDELLGIGPEAVDAVKYLLRELWVGHFL